MMKLATAEQEGTRAELDRAHAAAAADAGVAIALKGLLSDAIGNPMPIDGRPVRQRYGDADLVIHIEDETGKAPIDSLDDEQLTILLGFAGVSGEQLDIARDSLQDWVDDDDDPLAHGAEADYYAAAGVVPPNGSLRSIEELVRIRGWTPAMIERIRGFTTVSFGKHGFNRRTAQPKALQVMTGAATEGADAIQRRKEAEGQVTALDFSTPEPLTGRPLTIVVDVTLPDGARLRRRALIAVTGSKRRPYVVLGYS